MSDDLNTLNAFAMLFRFRVNAIEEQLGFDAAVAGACCSPLCKRSPCEAAWSSGRNKAIRVTNKVSHSQGKASIAATQPRRLESKLRGR